MDSDAIIDNIFNTNTADSNVFDAKENLEENNKRNRLGEQ